MGDAPEVLKLNPGLISANEEGNAGNGVIGEAMRDGISVIHMLNIRSLSAQTGIPYDSPPTMRAPVKVSLWWSVIGIVVFFGFLLTHRRWKLEPVGDQD